MNESLLKLLPDSEKIRREWASRRLLDFTKYTFPAYEENWHHVIVCEKLDAFARGEIKRLMVFMPPRHGKSELTSRRLPAFLLGRDPNAPLICCSYSADLASAMNRDVQKIIESESYHEIFPDTRLSSENVKTFAYGKYLRNSTVFEIVGHEGYYRSAGVGGGIVGMGARFVILDDPIKNREEATSQVYRDKLWDWFSSTMMTRLEAGGGVLLVVTRWHEDDLAGRIMKLQETDRNYERWEILKFPAIAEGELSEEDQREEGEILWPSRYDEKELAQRKAGLGSYQWSALYQQEPFPPGGSFIKREWFKIIITRPSNMRLARFWDLAATAAVAGRDPDYTVGVLMAKNASGHYFILDVVRVRTTPLGVETIIKQTAEVDGVQVDIGIEQEPGSSGVNTIDHYVREVLSGYPIRGYKTTGSKESRANPFSAAAEAGLISLVRGDWIGEFLAEAEAFPSGAHDDQIDATSGAFTILAPMRVGGPMTRIESIERKDPFDDMIGKYREPFEGM